MTYDEWEILAAILIQIRDLPNCQTWQERKAELQRELPEDGKAALSEIVNWFGGDQEV